jgi:hypothetical protein
MRGRLGLILVTATAGSRVDMAATPHGRPGEDNVVGSQDETAAQVMRHHSRPTISRAETYKSTEPQRELQNSARGNSNKINPSKRSPN